MKLARHLIIKNIHFIINLKSREERQLEAALRQIQKMEEREARRAAELKNNEAVSDSLIIAAHYSPVKNTNKINRCKAQHKLAASITKKAVKHSFKSGEKRKQENPSNSAASKVMLF